jgi:hypothetical protein
MHSVQYLLIYLVQPKQRTVLPLSFLWHWWHMFEVPSLFFVSCTSSHKQTHHVCTYKERLRLQSEQVLGNVSASYIIYISLMAWKILRDYICPFAVFIYIHQKQIKNWNMDVSNVGRMNKQFLMNKAQPIWTQTVLTTHPPLMNPYNWRYGRINKISKRFHLSHHRRIIYNRSSRPLPKLPGLGLKTRGVSSRIPHTLSCGSWCFSSLFIAVILELRNPARKWNMIRIIVF